MTKFRWARFKEYQHLWEHEGVYVMLAKFIADYHVKQVLLNETEENGERTITNLLQLMELLHKAQVQRQFSPLELIDWFKRGIEGMAVEGDEFVQRVESDEEAVKIVTVHKSKGLEYNIVFTPFLDLLANKEPEFVTFRDPGSGEYVYSDKALLSAEQLQLTEEQVEQENRRLLYVAVTRAVYKCYINKSTLGMFAQSALAPFVNIQKQVPSPLIAMEDAPELPEYYRYTETAEQFTPAYLQAEKFQLMQPNWRKLSYTYLDPEHAPVFRTAAATILNDYDQFVFRA
jgi:exodeoxyribonuclease V beta subunit